MRGRVHAAAFLRRLHALDDFATGSWSLAHLKDLPVDVLKIGRKFIRGIGTESRDERAIPTIVELGHDLGLRVVAEGVESRAQYMWLVSRRVDFAQGFHIGMPMTLAELARTRRADAWLTGRVRCRMRIGPPESWHVLPRAAARPRHIG